VATAVTCPVVTDDAAADSNVDSSAGDGGRSQVVAWLESGGVALEMKVVATFTAAFAAPRWIAPGLPARTRSRVDHAVPYTDKTADDTTKLREVDVIALMTKLTGSGDEAGLVCVVECKSSQKHPWVCFRRSAWAAQKLPRDLITQTAWMTSGTDNLAEWRSEPLFNVTGSSCYSIATARERDGRGERDGANFAKEAVAQVLSATNAASTQIVATNANRFGIFVPVVVTSASMFVVDLAPDGSLPEPVPTKRELLLGRFRLNDDAYRSVWVIHESEMENFANEAATTVARDL
jgi:hypothetical protein